MCYVIEDHGVVLVCSQAELIPITHHFFSQNVYIAKYFGPARRILCSASKIERYLSPLWKTDCCCERRALQLGCLSLACLWATKEGLQEYPCKNMDCIVRDSDYANPVHQCFNSMQHFCRDCGLVWLYPLLHLKQKTGRFSKRTSRRFR